MVNIIILIIKIICIIITFIIIIDNYHKYSAYNIKDSIAKKCLQILNYRVNV